MFINATVRADHVTVGNGLCISFTFFGLIILANVFAFIGSIKECSGYLGCDNVILGFNSWKF
jgi:hypothetical protein